MPSGKLSSICQSNTESPAILALREAARGRERRAARKTNQSRPSSRQKVLPEAPKIVRSSTWKWPEGHPASFQEKASLGGEGAGCRSKKCIRPQQSELHSRKAIAVQSFINIQAGGCGAEASGVAGFAEFFLAFVFLVFSVAVFESFFIHLIGL